MTNSNTVNKIEEQRFEFVLYINKHIICQRYFSVYDFKEKSIRSMDLKELMDRIMGINNGMGLIPKYLKNRAIDYLWKNYNSSFYQKKEEQKNIFDKGDVFNFEIKVDKQVIAQSTFSGSLFPLQVKYQVDIKEIIPHIISDIKETLSQKKYVLNYGDTQL